MVSVIVEASSRKEYKLDLMGGCDPDSAFMSIGLISRFGGGSCLDVGDTLVTDTRYANDICRIQKIYEWNKDAKPPATDAASGAPPASTAAAIGLKRNRQDGDDDIDRHSE